MSKYYVYTMSILCLYTMSIFYIYIYIEFVTRFYNTFINKKLILINYFCSAIVVN